MVRPVRIGNVHGFWGDRLGAAGEMLAREPDLEFLTLDFLAEVSMSILALQRSRDPAAGWPRDFLEIVRSIAPYWHGGGRCRMITNAGGLNPMSCAQACREVLAIAGCKGRTVAVVSGDDVLDQIVRRADINPSSLSPDDELLRNLDTGQAITEVSDRLVTANAYLGARPIAEALARGADLVITGRVADPSLTVGPCAHWFGWSWDDWDRLAGATIAGHLIECGTQLTGGISTDWLQMPEVESIGFPIAEVAEEGSCVVTKPRGSGGRVCEETVKEQLLYEIGDPDAYLSPDATVSLLSLDIDDRGADRVAIRGARGRPAPTTYKVSATYQDGFRAQGELTIFGVDAYAKARCAGEAVLRRLASNGISLRETVVECLVRACRRGEIDPILAGQLTEIVLRIAVADASREAVERFARELMPLVTAGPPGTTGYAEGRPRVHPLFRFWPCLIGRDCVEPRINILPVIEQCGEVSNVSFLPIEPDHDCTTSYSRNQDEKPSPAEATNKLPQQLRDLAYARSGDKGIHANIGVIARRPDDFPRLCREVTAERVAAHFGIADSSRVIRYEVPNLKALNFLIHGILASPLRIDAQGKTIGQVLLEMPLRNCSTSPRGCAINNDVLTIERLDEATTVLTFNRPQRRNALTIEMMESLCQAIDELKLEPRRRVVIFRGAGPAFCSGLDLAEAAEVELAEHSAQCVANLFQTIAESPLITIAAVHGSAYAGGAGLMACCDFIVAADDLRICFPEVRRGLVPALAAAVLRSRLCNSDLRELLLLAEPIDAQRALRMGLVDRVVDGAQLMAAAQAIADTVIQGGPQAVRQMKNLLHQLDPIDRRPLFARALEFHKQARLSAEAKEGLAAFREHRDPNWPSCIK